MLYDNTIKKNGTRQLYKYFEVQEHRDRQKRFMDTLLIFQNAFYISSQSSHLSSLLPGLPWSLNKGPLHSNRLT